jgi:hypothetical protein
MWSVRWYRSMTPVKGSIHLYWVSLSWCRPNNAFQGQSPSPYDCASVTKQWKKLHGMKEKYSLNCRQWNDLRKQGVSGLLFCWSWNWWIGQVDQWNGRSLWHRRDKGCRWLFSDNTLVFFRYLMKNARVGCNNIHKSESLV